MPLAMVNNGEKVKITKILLDDKTKKHLESLGITIGSELLVISSTSGDVVIEVKGSRLALSRSVSLKILVA